MKSLNRYIVTLHNPLLGSTSFSNPIVRPCDHILRHLYLWPDPRIVTAKWKTPLAQHKNEEAKLLGKIYRSFFLFTPGHSEKAFSN